MSKCDRCHGELGPSHKCVEVTTFCDHGPVYLDITRVSGQLYPAFKALEPAPTFWQSLKHFMKESW